MIKNYGSPWFGTTLTLKSIGASTILAFITYASYRMSRAYLITFITYASYRMSRAYLIKFPNVINRLVGKFEATGDSTVDVWTILCK